MLSILGVLACLLVPAQPPEPAFTFPVDPVRLLEKGEETVGSDGLAAVYERIRYTFADAASRDTFLHDPARYCVQLGGACARMGPMSGLCRTDLHAVVGGRLYMFASGA